MNWIYMMISLVILLLSAVLFLLCRRRWGNHISNEVPDKSGKKMASSGALFYAGMILAISSAILLLSMYTDMPYTGREGLFLRGIMAELALPSFVLALIWLMFSGPVLPEYAKLRKYGKYAFMVLVFIIMIPMSQVNPFGGVEDMFSGTITEDMALQHIMYEKTWTKSSSTYSFLFPEKSVGTFELMMESDQGYVHFNISAAERKILYPLADGIRVNGNPMNPDKLMQEVEKGRRSFSMYQSEQMNGGQDIICSVTYYPHSKILVSVKPY